MSVNFARLGSIVSLRDIPAKAELIRLCGLYNPVRLQRNVNKAILALREAVAAQSHSLWKGTCNLKLLFKMRHFGRALLAGLGTSPARLFAE